MITVTKKELSNMAFLNALNNLAMQRLPIKGAYGVKKVCDAVMRERKKVGAQFSETVLGKYVKKTETGEIVYEKDEHGNDDRNAPVIEEQNRADFMSAQDKFGEDTVQLDCYPIMLDHLGTSVTLTASDLSLLDKFLSELADVVQLNSQRTPSPEEPNSA